MKLSDGQYTHLMDAIELLHRENVAMMETILRCHLKPEQVDKCMKEVEENWQKAFNDVRRNNW